MDWLEFPAARVLPVAQVSHVQASAGTMGLTFRALNYDLQRVTYGRAHFPACLLRAAAADGCQAGQKAGSGRNLKESDKAFTGILLSETQ